MRKKEEKFKHLFKKWEVTFHFLLIQGQPAFSIKKIKTKERTEFHRTTTPSQLAYHFLTFLIRLINLF